LGRGSALWAIGSLLVAALCLAGSRLLWRFAQRSYTSASS
jgi:ABC-type uncharacterized transport system permease subunit